MVTSAVEQKKKCEGEGVLEHSFLHSFLLSLKGTLSLDKIDNSHHCEVE